MPLLLYCAADVVAVLIKPVVFYFCFAVVAVAAGTFKSCRKSLVTWTYASHSYLAAVPLLLAVCVKKHARTGESDGDGDAYK